MNNKQEYINKLNTINNSIIDTKFVLDDGKPYKGICMVLLIWIVSVLLVSSVISAIPYLAFSLNWIESEMYYTIYRIAYIILVTLPVLIYYLSIRQINMTLKELSFLKIFSFIPVLISFFKLLTPLSYYLNVNFLLTLYNVIPIDFLLLGLGIYLLKCYFDLKPLNYVIIMITIYIIIFSSIKIITFQQNELTDLMLMVVNIRNIFDILHSFSITLFIFILLTLDIVRYTYEQ